MGQKHDREFEEKNENQNRGYIFRPFRYLEQNSGIITFNKIIGVKTLKS